MMKAILILFLFLSSLGANDVDIKSVFKQYGFKGTMIVSSLKTDKTYVYNKSRSKVKFSPASTFKIPSTLIALQEKVIKDKNTVIKWDGKDKGFGVWNQDHSVKSAFDVSCVWCYQELAKKITLKKFKKYIELMHYGNEKVGDNVTNFWLDSTLKISASGQIELLKKIYLDDLPFDKKNIELLKEVMLSNKTKKYEIYSKTGWALKSKIGWYVGYMKTKDDVLFFAMNMDMSKIKDARFRKIITMEVLKEITPSSFNNL